MIGMSSITGKALEGLEHLRQSIRDILTTPIGSRVMRRGYGSRLFELIDRPINSRWIIDAFAYVAEALDKWEPRFALSKVETEPGDNVERGNVILAVEGRYLPDGEEIRLEGIII
jgi:phage baseplate assembly protein W